MSDHQEFVLMVYKLGIEMPHLSEVINVKKRYILYIPNQCCISLNGGLSKLLITPPSSSELKLCSAQMCTPSSSTWTISFT